MVIALLLFPIVAPLFVVWGVLVSLIVLVATKKNPGDDATISIQLTANLILIPSVTTIGAAGISFGFFVASTDIVSAVIAVVASIVAVIAWSTTIAQMVAAHESGRSLSLWESDIDPADGVRILREQRAKSGASAFPDVANRAIRDAHEAASTNTTPNSARVVALKSMWRRFPSFLFKKHSVLSVFATVWFLVMTFATWRAVDSGAPVGQIISASVIGVSALLAFPMMMAAIYLEAWTNRYASVLRESTLAARMNNDGVSAGLTWLAEFLSRWR